MKEFFKTIYYSKRVRSFLWRIGAVMAVAGLAEVSAQLNVIVVDPKLQVFIGLILGEITKAVNNWYSTNYAK